MGGALTSIASGGGTALVAPVVFGPGLVEGTTATTLPLSTISEPKAASAAMQDDQVRLSGVQAGRGADARADSAERHHLHQRIPEDDFGLPILCQTEIPVLQLQLAPLLVKAIQGTKVIAIAHHADADGVATALLIKRALVRLGFPTERIHCYPVNTMDRSIAPWHREGITTLDPAPALLIMADFISNTFDDVRELKAALPDTDIINVDHHALKNIVGWSNAHALVANSPRLYRPAKPWHLVASGFARRLFFLSDPKKELPLPEQDNWLERVGMIGDLVIKKESPGHATDDEFKVADILNTIGNARILQADPRQLNQRQSELFDLLETSTDASDFMRRFYSEPTYIQQRELYEAIQADMARAIEGIRALTTKEGQIYRYHIQADTNAWCIDPILKSSLKYLPKNVTLILTQEGFPDVYMSSTVPTPGEDETFHCGDILQELAAGRGGGHCHRAGSVPQGSQSDFLVRLRERVNDEMRSLGVSVP